MTTEDIFARALRAMRILWAALLVSTLLLVLVVAIVPGDTRHPVDQNVLVMLGACGLALAIVSFILPARIHAAGARAREVEVIQPEPVPGLTPPRHFAHPAKVARSAVAIGMQPFILSVALSEAVSMLGLAAHMIGAPIPIAAPFLAAGTLLVAIRFPTRDRLVGPFERARGATFAPYPGA